MTRSRTMILCITALMLAACGSSTSSGPSLSPAAAISPIPSAATGPTPAPTISTVGWQTYKMPTAGSILHPPLWGPITPTMFYGNLSSKQITDLGWVIVFLNTDPQQADATSSITIAKVPKNSTPLREWAVSNIGSMYPSTFQVLGISETTLAGFPAIEIRGTMPTDDAAKGPPYFLIDTIETSDSRYVFYGMALTNKYAALILPVIRAIYNSFVPSVR